MNIFKNLAISAAVVVIVSACGGGGGSPGEVHGPYSVTLTADRVQLPANTAHQGPGIGVYSPYTTTVYVKATENDSPIPGGKDIFACNVDSGLNTGVLYYLDGDPDHETTDKSGNQIPNSYRSITLGSNSGGNSFHFHAGDQAGNATITCSAQSPRDKKYYSASIVITVGASSGKVANVTGQSQSNVLGTQGNLSNLPTSTHINVHVLDDANQPVPDSGVKNVQVSIRSGTGAAAGARLMADGNTGSTSTLWLRTTGGIASFSLSSGTGEGPIVLDIIGDRADNDVTNGIQDPVVGTLVITAVSKVAPTTDPLTIATTSIDGTPSVGVPFSYVLEATGGLPPYTWTAVGGMPAGLSLSSDGVISGSPTITGPVSFAVRVADSAGNTKSANYSVTIGGTLPTAPLTIVGCTTDINTPCALVTATRGDPFTGYAFTTSGGPAAGAVAWTGTAPAPWTLSGAGILTGPSPVAAACGNYDFFATATKGTESVTHKIRVTIAAGATPC